MTNQNKKPILISGAGLCSLLLAQSLLRSHIPFHIFERDTSFTTRSQGYRLRLSSEALDAIESVLGPEHFSEFWEKCGKTGGGGFGGLDARTGERLEEPFPVGKEAGGGEKERYKESLGSRDGRIVGISRGEMRGVFIKGCEEFISWGKRVVSYELTENGVVAVFSDGTKSEEGDMLIGGEGIHSEIARQVSGGKLKVYDTGARAIQGQANSTAFRGLEEGVWRLVDEQNPAGKVFVITNIRPGDKDDPKVQFGWTMGAVPGVIKAPNDDYTTLGAPAANIAKNLTRDWNEKFRPLFEEMNVDEAAFWKITCSTPTGVPEWESEKRVTVIGDAVHSMTPAGGIGASTAVRDSALLGRLLGEKGGYAEGVTKEYEDEMRVYGSHAVRTSYGLAKVGFGINIDENSKVV